jgi:ribonuclease HI
LRAFPQGAEVTVRTDSQYVVKTMTQGWKRRENLDLWRELDAEAAQRLVRWEWVRGHAGDEHNEHADELARTAAATATKSPPRSPSAKSRLSSARDESEERTIADLDPMLRPGEIVRHCAACRKLFVAGDDSRYCSLAPCQIKARRATTR